MNKNEYGKETERSDSNRVEFKSNSNWISHLACVQFANLSEMHKRVKCMARQHTHTHTRAWTRAHEVQLCKKTKSINVRYNQVPKLTYRIQPLINKRDIVRTAHVSTPSYRMYETRDNMSLKSILTVCNFDGNMGVDRSYYHETQMRELSIWRAPVHTKQTTYSHIHIVHKITNE